MAAKDDKVRDLVEKALRRNPKVTNQDLYARAKKVDPSVGKLSLRQFHAKYPLQVKRRRSPKKRRRTNGRKPAAAAKRAPKAASGAVNRDAVRKSLMRFAKDVSAAQNKTETIDILSNVDRYVDDVVKAVR